MNTYIGLMRKEQNSDYSVDFPDFAGCISAGRTMDEARKMAEEALSGHIQVMQELGERLPEPSTLDQVFTKKENENALAFLVIPKKMKQKHVRINITVPSLVLDDLDMYATEIGSSRSHLISDAVRQYLAQH